MGLKHQALTRLGESYNSVRISTRGRNDGTGPVPGIGLGVQEALQVSAGCPLGIGVADGLRDQRRGHELADALNRLGFQLGFDVLDEPLQGRGREFFDSSFAEGFTSRCR